MARRPWTEQEVARLRAEYPNRRTADIAREFGRSTSAVYGKADALGLQKSQAFLSSPESGRTLPGSARGADARFLPGHKPHNKGVKGWQAGGNAKKTQFKKGHRPHTWKPIGSERLTKDGYLQRKITDTGYTPRDWKFVHVMLWESQHGPLPKGHMLVFRNGDKTDIRLDNLECITRAENMRRNTVHTLPKALAELCQLKGAVTRQINKRAKREKQD